MATVPKQLATPEDTFTALALQFNFEERIKDKIIELGIRNIAEFRHYARSEDEIKKLFIDTIKDPAYEEMQGRLQAARLRFVDGVQSLTGLRARSGQPASSADGGRDAASQTGARTVERGVLSTLPLASRTSPVSL